MEAEKAFGNGAVYIEKFIVNPHHIEFQVFGDEHGRVVHLGERDCSLQRRSQKIAEECPSPLMTADLRQRMGEASIKLCESVGYTNAGTIEYLVDDDGNFYFKEMNTRIQMEHPITEEVYGCDLVKQQIQVAADEHLNNHVIEAQPRSHAIECRINAEDSAKNFMPYPGNIELYYAPGGHGVRIDSHTYAGYPITPNYDSMIARAIATACINRMSRALNEYMITGIKTTIPFSRRSCKTPNSGKENTTPDSWRSSCATARPWSVDAAVLPFHLIAPPIRQGARTVAGLNFLRIPVPPLEIRS